MFDRQARPALILVCITLALAGLGFRAAVRSLNVYLRKLPVDLREHFDNIPATLGAWRSEGGSEKLADEVVEALGTRLYLERQYVLDDGAPEETRLALHIAYYTGIIDAVPHVVDRCLVAAGFNARTTPHNYVLPLSRSGWRRVPGPPGEEGAEEVTLRDPVTGMPVTVRMPTGELSLRTTEFSHADYPKARIYGGYFFIANGRAAATPEQVKLLAFSKSERYAYYCKVQFLMVGGSDLTAEQFVARCASLSDVLLPQVMRCLPDWSAVGASGAGAPGGTSP